MPPPHEPRLIPPPLAPPRPPTAHSHEFSSGLYFTPPNYQPLSSRLLSIIPVPVFFFFFVIQDAPCSLWCACLVFFRRFLCRWLLFLLANRFISWSLKNLPTSISNVESAWHFKIGIKFFIHPAFHGQLEAVLCRRGINRLFVITVCNVVN